MDEKLNKNAEYSRDRGPLNFAVQQYRNFRDRLIEDMPELLDDPECLTDTLDGISDVKEQMATVIRSAVMDEALAGGLSNYIAKLQSRHTYLVNKAKKKRTIVLNHMCDLDIRRIIESDLSITRRTVPPRVIIIDDTQVPDKYCTIERKPNRAQINNAIKAGEKVPGTELSNSSETIQVRV